MIGRSGSGWQTTTADLALILFFVVSAAATKPGPASGGNGKPLVQKVAAPAIEATPSAAIYRPTEGTTLTQWLRSQPRDDRQVATVLVSRSPNGSAPAMTQALGFLDEIEASGRSGRLLVERGDADDVTVVLAYERAPASGTALALR
jgi:hypothetical protein